MDSSKFKFLVLNSSDPQAQYDAITTKDPLTFYILTTGKGYLGDTPMFDAATCKNGENNVIFLGAEELTSPEEKKLYVLNETIYKEGTLTGLYVYDGTSMNPLSGGAVEVESVTSINGDTPSDTKLVTEKAVVDYINTALSSVVTYETNNTATIELKDITNQEIMAANNFIGNFTDICTVYTPELEPESTYTFEAQYYGKNANLSTYVEKIVYIDDTLKYNKTYNTADVLNGHLTGGTDTISSGELTIPVGYYKLIEINPATDEDSTNIVRVKFGRYDDSGNVSPISLSVSDSCGGLQYFGSSIKVDV